jgi:hypothetical protein
MYHMRLTTGLLADAAAVENGKLFVHGGGWDRITVAQLPAIHPSLALVLVFQVEYDEALRDLDVTIDLVDEDQQPSGVHITGVLNVGHAPRTKRGAPTFVPQAITIQQLELGHAGRFRFRITSSGEELGNVPFEVHHQPSFDAAPPAKEV